MIPVLHLHHIQSIHHTDLDAAQQIRAILPFRRHLDPQRTRDENIAVHQLRLVRRHHHNSPSFACDLDTDTEVVIAVPSKVDDVVDGVTGGSRWVSKRVFTNVRWEGERGDERPEIFDLGARGRKREEVSSEIVQHERAEGCEEEDFGACE